MMPSSVYLNGKPGIRNAEHTRTGSFESLFPTEHSAFPTDFGSGADRFFGNRGDRSFFDRFPGQGGPRAQHYFGDFGGAASGPHRSSSQSSFSSGRGSDTGADMSVRERVIPIKIEGATASAPSTTASTSTNQPSSTHVQTPGPTATPTNSASAKPATEPATNSDTAKNVNWKSPVDNLPKQLAQNAPKFPTMAAPPKVERSKSIEGLSDNLLSMLDEIERRVENLRETANVMEQEREFLLEMLNTVQLNTGTLRINKNDQEDLEAATNRLITRCKTVHVMVNTPRTQEQEKALQFVNQQIDDLLKKVGDDLDSSRKICKAFLNACNPDEPDGPMDSKFQSLVIGCTADDQKRIRRKLEQTLNTIDTMEKAAANALN